MGPAWLVHVPLAARNSYAEVHAVYQHRTRCECSWTSRRQMAAPTGVAVNFTTWARWSAPMAKRRTHARTNSPRCTPTKGLMLTFDDFLIGNGAVRASAIQPADAVARLGAQAGGSGVVLGGRGHSSGAVSFREGQQRRATGSRAPPRRHSKTIRGK